MAGLMLLMTALKDKALSHLPVFLNKLTNQLKSHVCAIYKNSLNILYQDTRVRSWFADNVMRLEACHCEVAEFLNSNKDYWQFSHGLLQISRICILPSNYDGLLGVHHLLAKSGYLTWITEALDKIPVQQKMQFEEFQSLALTIGEMEWQMLLNDGKDHLTSIQVHCWPQAIQKMIDEDPSAGKPSQSMSDVLASL